MKKVSKDLNFYAFSSLVNPVIEVDIGEKILIETHDARRGRLKTNEDIFTSAPNLSDKIPKANPCTGPIAIRGIKAGDVIKIKIHDIKVSSRGFIVHKNTTGICKHMIPEPTAVFADIDKDVIRLDCGPTIDLNPHIGTIGITPEGEPIATFLAGDHGGNMDCSFVEAGAEIYLRTSVDSALIGVGDLHAAMGHGELMGSAVEVGGVVELSVGQTKGLEIFRPVIRSRSKIMTVASSIDIRAAIKTASEDLVRLLETYGNMTKIAALSLLTTVCDVKVCQASDENIFAVIAIAIDEKYLPFLHYNQSS